MASRGSVVRGRALLAGVMALALPGTALADDLRGALAAAYATNPTLEAARATLRATDEGVPIARADGLPSANGTASETEYVHESPLLTAAGARLLTVTGTLSVPLYSGGGVRNAIGAAERRVDAGRADLRGSESAVFTQVVASYLDVILNEAVVRLNRAQVRTLTTNLQATSDRFQIGELTRTDVAQSQSRLALAQGNLKSAESNLIQARESYIRQVGKAPEALEPPPPLPGLPSSAEEAVQAALDHNPDLAGAAARAKAARLDSKAAGASRLPRVTLFADGNYSNYLNTLSVIGVPSGAIPQSGTAADVGVRATIPLFQGGRPAAQISQAEARESAALENQIATERAVIAQTRAAFSSWRAANEIIASTQAAVDAAALSLEGVRAENGVGNRTILDILNAEQELVNAQVQLVTARRNAYVAGFSLLAAMGRAEARDLGLDSGMLYDPTAHYHQAKAQWWDWSADPTPKARAKRTVDTPAQDGSIPAK
ncbi:MAG: TolC family outer membrane protein [Proteobacteria bacterium]|nr:TolC family outer membrane protein [Pseudomonadota bacterium]